MYSLTHRASQAWRSVHHAAKAKGMATVAEGRIGDTKVPMSLLEKNAYINYQRIEDNLVIIRERCVFVAFAVVVWALMRGSKGYNGHSRFPRRSFTVILMTHTIRTSPVASATSSSGQTCVFSIISSSTSILTSAYTASSLPGRYCSGWLSALTSSSPKSSRDGMSDVTSSVMHYRWLCFNLCLLVWTRQPSPPPSTATT